MGVHGNPQADLGPSLPPMGELRRVTVEAHQLVLILLDTTVHGPGGDHQRAARTMERLRAVVGPPLERES